MGGGELPVRCLSEPFLAFGATHAPVVGGTWVAAVEGEAALSVATRWQACCSHARERLRHISPWGWGSGERNMSRRVSGPL